MRQGASGRRTRGRSGGRKHVPLKMQNFDSNGPDVRVRGNANQVYDKYLALARDANAAGDRIVAESYYQHAEHYYRIINETTDPQAEDQNRGEPKHGESAAPNGGEGEQQGRGRGSRQERRERREQAEREQRGATDGESEQGSGQGDETVAEAPAGGQGDKSESYRRPDGYGRLDGEQPGDAAGGDGGGDAQGELLQEADGAPASTEHESAAGPADEVAEGEEKPKRGRGRSRKTSTSSSTGTRGRKSASTKPAKAKKSQADGSGDSAPSSGRDGGVQDSDGDGDGGKADSGGESGNGDQPNA